MESDKWIRKLFALLESMGFELQAAQSHRKVVYTGDKLSKPCTLIIQSHAKESSKRDIMSYIKRTLRAADAPADMISQLDSFPIGFIADGMTISQIDHALYDALKYHDNLLIAEIALELGKALAEQNNDYQVTAIDKTNADKIYHQNLQQCFKNINDILRNIFEQALQAEIDIYGSYELTPYQNSRNIEHFDTEIYDKYSLKITGSSKSDDEFILNCEFTNDLGDILISGGFGSLFSVSFNGDEYLDCYTITSIHEIYRFSSLINWNLSLDEAREVLDKVNQEQVKIYLR